jgi:hypothetical protein
MDFARMLEKYGGSRGIAAQANARRVRVRGVPCVAKLIVHRTASGKHAPGGVLAKTAFETEREVYRRLGPSWPVTLVEALKARSGQTSGYVVDRAVGIVCTVEVERRRRRARAGRRPCGRSPRSTARASCTACTGTCSPRTSASRSACYARCPSPPPTACSRGSAAPLEKLPGSHSKKPPFFAPP